MAKPNDPRVQIGFRVPRDLYDALTAECSLRGMTMQDFIMSAIRLFSQTPPIPVDRIDIISYTNYGNVSQEEIDRRNLYLSLLQRYVNEMPPEKSEVLIKAIQWDLGMLKSTRRKNAPGRSKKGLQRNVKGSK